MWGILVALLLVGCGAAEERRPNVLLVTIESLRTDHVGAYGGHSRTRPQVPLTPALDALAAERDWALDTRNRYAHARAELDLLLDRATDAPASETLVQALGSPARRGTTGAP